MSLRARVLGATLGVLVLSQAAEWTQQYLQRLGGAADELRAVVERFDEGARALDLPRAEALGRLKASPDRFVARQGTDAEATIARFEATERRYRALLATAPLLRPFAALADLDPGIASRASGDFRPALPATPDGVALTFLGFLGGWGAGAGSSGAWRMARRRRPT
ncbi:hypothetical protein GCM10011390_46810 [Aureimonas endophytica]|uniref:DUF2937 family protein n=1 Tax=Aureimonas endophytica TaxID=2027858 RepID=A0A917EBW7_9HYPH|nr:DUF2937 family protein [Aureimonas endophytica]GGE22087.1 hypothetical protein GCM10011390_46810 [Aureimonas endophytica]